MDTPGLRQTYLPDGAPVRFGTIFKNPDLSRFYETLARSGPQTFYEGEIAERIVAFSKAHGGYFSRRDFRDHRADWIEPVSAGYRGYDVWELPPNGQGIAVLQMLNLLEHFDVGSMQPNSAEHLHLFLEAKKLAFEDRAVYYADMDFADVPLKQLISKEYAAERVKLIDKDHAAQQVRPGRKGSSDTIYLTAADREGNMISLIQSIYYGWGSGYVPDGLGFCLQNRGQLFSLDPSHLNKLQPHKRPFHTIIPAFVTRDDRPVFSFGVMGGSFQPQGQTQVLMNLIDFGMSVQQAGEQPRIEHGESSEPTGTKMVGSGSVGFERGIGDDVKLSSSPPWATTSAPPSAPGAATRASGDRTTRYATSPAPTPEKTAPPSAIDTAAGTRLTAAGCRCGFRARWRCGWRFGSGFFRARSGRR